MTLLERVVVLHFVTSHIIALNATQYFFLSFPITSDVEDCDGAGASAVREAIRRDVVNVINTEVKNELNSILRAKYLGQTDRYPANNCKEILDAFPDTESGYFWIINPSGRVFQAYCNMNLSCGPSNNITGWMRVANVDLSDLSQSCPTGNFRLVPGPTRYCVRDRPNVGGCDNTTFSTLQVPYTQVCGRATGIQIGTVDGFLMENPTATIDQVYTDGISLTYGSNPRTHIWTFAAAISEMYTTCPCSTGSSDNAPSFVGMDYFCESGATSGNVDNSVFPNDNLWDGQMCRNVETPCCMGNFNPPWFYRNLGDQLTADIEMRLCIDQGGDEDIGLKAAEIYVQ